MEPISSGKGFWEVLPPEVCQQICGYVVDDLFGSCRNTVHIVGVAEGLHAVSCCPAPDMDYLRRVDHLCDADAYADQNRHLTWRRRRMGKRAVVSPFRNGHLSCQVTATEMHLGEPGPLMSCLRVCKGL